MSFYDYQDLTNGHYHIIKQVAGLEWDEDLTKDERVEILDQLFESDTLTERQIAKGDFAMYTGDESWDELDADAQLEIAKYMENVKGGL